MSEKQVRNQNIGLLGGSFNPVHIGHLRLGLEMLEQAGLDRVQFVPAYIPPHKDSKRVLPFDMRRDMLESSIQGWSSLEVNCMEKNRPGPSYTLDTLESYVQEYPGQEPFFILGDGDLLTMPNWHRGREIPYLSNLLVIGREGEDAEIAEFISGFWESFQVQDYIWQVKKGREIRYLSVPRIDVSSSMIRARWLAGKSIDWLVPESVQKYLRARSGEVQGIWE